MKHTTRTLLPLIALSMLLLSGCQTRLQVDQVKRLLLHPQFPQARESAPIWAREALTVINDQQQEIQKLRAQ